jgi:hypothetical protein
MLLEYCKTVLSRGNASQLKMRTPLVRRWLYPCHPATPSLALNDVSLWAGASVSAPLPMVRLLPKRQEKQTWRVGLSGAERFAQTGAFTSV